jgi:hypothetical protein
VYEFTDQQEIVGYSPDGVKVKDSLLISVGKRINAVGDKPPYAGYFGYEDHNQLENGAQVAKPSWSHVELDGILMYQLH